LAKFGHQGGFRQQQSAVAVGQFAVQGYLGRTLYVIDSGPGVVFRFIRHIKNAVIVRNRRMIRDVVNIIRVLWLGDEVVEIRVAQFANGAVRIGEMFQQHVFFGRGLGH